MLNMIPYFSTKLNVLEISKSMLLMVDQLVIVQFLFCCCSPNIEWVTILLNIFIFFYCQNYKHDDCLCLHFLQTFQLSRLDILWTAYRQKSDFCLLLAVTISCKSPPSSDELWADVPSMFYVWFKYRGNRSSSFPVPNGTRNRPIQSGSSTGASFGRENDFCENADWQKAVCSCATLWCADDTTKSNSKFRFSMRTISIKKIK